MTDGTYWLNLPAKTPDKDPDPFPFLALVEHTNYMDGALMGGTDLLSGRLFAYLTIRTSR